MSEVAPKSPAIRSQSAHCSEEGSVMGLERRERRKVEDVKDQPQENRPATVSSNQETKQAGETLPRWDWVEPSVWTTRMLTALENGVKGGKWFSLMDKVYGIENLRVSFAKVKKNGGARGIDQISTQLYEKQGEINLLRLQKRLQEGSYRPSPVRRVWIPKPGNPNEKRPLGIPTVEDRIVQTALRNVMEPIYEKGFAECSYGFRPHRGCKDALRQVERLLQKGYRWVVDADIQRFFDTIPFEPLMRETEKQVADGRVLELLRGYLTQGVMESGKQGNPTQGTPQGAVISPLLANIYLNPLDHLLEATGHQMIRYADDLVIFSQTQEEAQEALQLLQNWMKQAHLQLHPEKTRVVDMDRNEGFNFLGYHFQRGTRWPTRKSLRKLKENLRKKTHRSNGQSLQIIIQDVNDSLRGWFNYFQHSCHPAFRPIDQWIRMRLRSILRKRNGGHGRERGTDHKRWTNSFFTLWGLFSLTDSHRVLCQSLRR